MSTPASLFSRVVVATDLEPDDVAMLYMLCARAVNECTEPTIRVLLGEGIDEVKMCVWERVALALTKHFPEVTLQGVYNGEESPVEYDWVQLDAAFNFDRKKVDRGIPAWAWNSALQDATLVIVVRPPREMLVDPVMDFQSTPAPLYMYGGYNIRCCKTTPELFRKLAAKFRGGVYVVERSDFLGEYFDPAEDLPLLESALNSKTPFGGVLRNLCTVWNTGMLAYKKQKLEANFKTEEALREYLDNPSFQKLDDLDERDLLHNYTRAVMDRISVRSITLHPDTTLLWADPLVVSLIGHSEVWEHTCDVSSTGSGDSNPVFVQKDDGLFRLARSWSTLSPFEQKARMLAIGKACTEWFQ